MPGALQPSAVLGVARGPFLLLPVLLVASAAAAAARSGDFSWTHTALAMFGLLLLHVAVNVFNEVGDFRSGIDLQTTRTPFSGGSGTLPAGQLSVSAARKIGLITFTGGLAVGIWFILRFGWPMVVITLSGVLCVVLYTPLLLRVGLGELAAGLGLGALPVLGTGLVQSGVISPAVWALALPAWAMTFNLLLLNEFPDEVADRAGGRRHLVILLGRSRAAKLFLAAAFLAMAGIIGPVVLELWPPAALLALIPVLALVPALRWALRAPNEAVPIPALAGNVAWNLATHAVLAGVFVFA